MDGYHGTQSMDTMSDGRVLWVMYMGTLFKGYDVKGSLWMTRAVSEGSWCSKHNTSSTTAVSDRVASN